MHAKPTTGRRRRRVLIGSVLALLAAAGTAVAIILYLLNVTGTWSGASFLPQWATSPTPTVVSSEGMTATPSISGTSLQVNVANAHEGSSATIEANAKLQAGATESGKIVGLQGTIPAGWTVELVNGTCGKSLAMAGTNATVQFKITRGTGAAASGSPTGLALQVQPASVAPATPTCPVLTGS
jgi:hypothetical protein